ncbi:site-specific integrase [Flavobacterium sp. MFBS3-15]|uniref:site-specific integrase n=1 Tax=Flavobacterium sp. MFBS3-15 TaxID=2989816 RepID=UPI002235F69D|nr:site-specific integrase [Flavobacterium sp. MFBS3-15]MCW4470350.1 site-specific integrase [Flavobacterium sp. MFBS3-15]
MSASIRIKLKEKPTKEGLYPIVLSIIKDRKAKVIALGIKCLKKDWDEGSSKLKKSDNNYVQRNRILLQRQEEALKIIDEFELEKLDFTLTQFESRFRGAKDVNISMKQFWEEKINDLNLAGRTGNARAYKDTMTSFYKFAKNEKLMFREVNVEMLDKYETYLRSTGSKDGGIGVRMRELRALFNDGIKKGIVDEKYYPFKAYKVSKLKGKGLKRALTHKEIKLIEELDEEQHPELIQSKKLFMFSFYTRGMNFYDMMKLTWDNIQGNYIVYSRSKTKVGFRIEILPPVMKILDEYRDRKSTTNYVFPILLHRDLTPVQIENRKAKKLKQFNSDLKKIAEIQGIYSTVTSYVARHSYATILRYLGVSTEAISQSMGHSNVGITTAYLKEFEQDDIDIINRKLIEESIPIYKTDINQWPTSA